jgi:flagellar hook-associated protein 3 FlgL
MRVTAGMINSRVVFNMQRSLRRFMNLEINMSSGRRINKPSDDPSGTVRDLTYRTELAKIAQYQKNVGQALNWMGAYETVLTDAKNFISSAKEVAVAMANGNYDDVAREASAREIESIFERMIQLANTELEGRRMFSGFRTRTEPLEVSANGVVYRGDDGEIQFDIESALRMTVNLTGADVFLAPLSPLGEDSDINIAVTGDTLLADLNHGSGVDLSPAPGSITISDENLNIVSSIDLSAATTVQDVIDTINAQLMLDGITNLTVGLDPEGNSLAFTTVQTGRISTHTHLDKLNNGLGVDMQPGKLRISNESGVDVVVDFSNPVSVPGVATIGDVITEFNSQLAAAGVNNVTMAVNGAGTGLVISDGNVPPLDLTVSEVSDSDQTAHGLGIAGFVGAAMTGSDLEPVVHFKVEETGGTTATDLGILGEFSSDHSGDDIDPLLTVNSRVADFRNGSGIDRDRFVIHQGASSFTVDLSSAAVATVQDLLDVINNSGLDVTASINADGRGIQIVNNDGTRSLTVEDVRSGRTAKALGIYGSSDVLGGLLVLGNALRNDDQEATGMLLKNLDEAIQHLLNYRGTVGSRSIKLESTGVRLTDSHLSFTELLSEVEDADISELVTRLATYENNYQASLIAGAKIIQPTLLDFLE